MLKELKEDMENIKKKVFEQSGNTSMEIENLKKKILEPKSTIIERKISKAYLNRQINQSTGEQDNENYQVKGMEREKIYNCGIRKPPYTLWKSQKGREKREEII